MTGIPKPNFLARNSHFNYSIILENVVTICSQYTDSDTYLVHVGYIYTLYDASFTM